MKTPSPSQMRALQLLREGKLIWRGPENSSLEKEWSEVKYAVPVDLRIYPVTARILVDRGWVELKGFNPKQGIYRLSAKGKELSGMICECKAPKGKGKEGRRVEEFTLLNGVEPATTAKIDWPKQRLLCAKCWRLARCEAKFFKHPHAANRYVWGVGPVCQFHLDNPTKR